MRFSIFQDSALGHRSENQDRMGYVFTRDCLLMVVADGMGGHQRGEVAAQLALQVPATLFQQAARPRLADPAAFLDDALRAAHRDILRYQVQHDMPESPRTTVVACVVQDGCAWWAHAGDSRAYLVRDRRVLVRTRDHSKVQTLMALGLIQPGEEENHPDRNKVLNCLGSPFEPTIDLAAPVPLEPGDRMLLCSDGLWSGMPEAELVRLLGDHPVGAAVPMLIDRAVKGQGRGADNTTAIAMLWEGVSDDEMLSSLALPDGAFTSTIVQQVGEAAPERDLTEEEIERTIREIRSAIEKTNAK